MLTDKHVQYARKDNEQICFLFNKWENGPGRAWTRNLQTCDNAGTWCCFKNEWCFHFQFLKAAYMRMLVSSTYKISQKEKGIHSEGTE